MSNTKNKPKADGLFCKRCKATSGVFFRGLCGNCWVERAEMAERALDRACMEIVDHAECCPIDVAWNGCEHDGESCNDVHAAACWKKYFMEENE